MLPAIAFLFLELLARWAQSSVAQRSAGVFPASQKLPAHLIAGFSCLERKVSINTPELERIVAAMAGLDWTKTTTWGAGTGMAWANAEKMDILIYSPDRNRYELYITHVFHEKYLLIAWMRAVS